MIAGDSNKETILLFFAEFTFLMFVAEILITVMLVTT